MDLTPPEDSPSASISDLTDAILSDRWLDLGSHTESMSSIDAALIVETYRRLQHGGLAMDEAGQPRHTTPRLNEVKIRNAVIRGQIDLTGCEDIAGGGIASLILDQCIFERACDENHQPDLDLSNTTIRSVQVTNCRLSHIRANGAQVMRSVDLSGSAPRDTILAKMWSQRAEQNADAHFEAYFAKTPDHPDTPPPEFLIESRTIGDAGFDQAQAESEFWVEMRDIRITGDLIARRTVLRTPRIRALKSYKPWETRYALQLAGARIQGSIKAHDESIFDGGVNLPLAKVDGEIWLGGAHIRAGEGGAIDAMTSDIGGLYAAWPRLLVKGEINLDRAQVRGDLLLPNAIIECDPSQPRSSDSTPKAISATASSIANDCLLHGKLLANGGIYARSIEVGGDLSVANAQIVSHDHFSVELDFASIAGRTDFKGGCFVGTVGLRATDIKTNLDFNQSTIYGRCAPDENTVKAIAGMDLVVGHNCLLGECGVAHGSVNLVRANIHSDLGIYRLSIQLTDQDSETPSRFKEYALDLGWANIGGNLILNKNEFAGRLRLSHGRARVLCDTKSGYPEKANTLYLNGFAYEALLHHSMDVDQSDASTCVSSRLDWLEKMPRYDPQPYIWLSQILSRDGRKEESREIFIEKQNRDRRQKRNEIKRGNRLMWLPRMIILFSSQLFHWMFGDGLKPVNALVTLFLAALIGTSVFWYANHQRLLIVDQQAVATGVSQSRIGAVVSDEIDDSVWCSDNISPAIYALDVFVPLVDLRHESACKVGESSAAEQEARFPAAFDLVNARTQVTVLSYFKAVYSILGWLLISLAIITFSGAVRRRLEP